MTGISGGYSLPGFTDARESAENSFLWGQTGNEHFPVLMFRAQISGASRDSGATPTTDLRPGLVLAQKADGTFCEYDATDETKNKAAGICPLGVRMVDEDNNNINQFVPIIVGGAVQAANLYGLDTQARAQLAPNFVFDDDLYGDPLPYKQPVAKTADYTLVEADSGKLFHTTGATGAVNFTLPTIEPGLRFRFHNTVDQNMVITSAAGNDIVALNDFAASTITFSTASQKIGAAVEIYAVGSKWFATFLSSATATIA